MSEKADVVIVGAGPVGLWAAIQILQRRPDMNVRLYERHTEYKRSHVLRLEALSTVLYTESSGNARKDQFYQEIFGKSLSRIFMSAATGSVFIRTNDLEQALKSYATDLGAEIIYDRVSSPEAIMARHPGCKTFIAADGAKSPMRVALLGPDEAAVQTTPLQYITEVKYRAEGEAGRLDLAEQYKTQKLLSHLAFEYVGREKEGYTPVSLRFFLNRKTYDAVPDATFAKPLAINDDGLASATPDLATDIHRYMKARELHAHENYDEGSAKLTKLTLSAYVANKWATTHEGRNWYLVGDAAMGVPYFRALNSGFFVGSQLGNIVTRDWISESNRRRLYNAIRPLDKIWEFTGAHSKNGGLKMYDSFRRANADLPFQPLRWGREDTEEICTEKPVENDRPKIV
jgi:2-polyprenyl-6-methoxyphenol hydroxylase-like FAD-dependent oxidoreductase